MSHYRSSLRDIEFNLFEVFGVGDLLGRERYTELDAAVVQQILADVEQLSTTKLAASFAPGDRQPPVLIPETGKVLLGDPIKKSFQALLGSQYWRMWLPTELSGTAVPYALQWSLAELLLGANPAVALYAGSLAFAGLLHLVGSSSQRNWARLFTEKQWCATIAITESEAGSDVGAIRTRALPQPDGSWHIEGTKRFISGGEHDLTENIIHYVLARPVTETVVPGTQGLSLFVVPKYLFDPVTGDLGERNGVVAVRTESTMGLRASSTCELAFGMHTAAKGWLVGDVHDGIHQIFHLVEFARMMVGVKAIATLSTGYRNALEYARGRTQGSDLSRLDDPTAPRVAIIRHPEVRRSLMLQKSYSEGLRALVCYTACWQELAHFANAGIDGTQRKAAKKVAALLLPLVKGCSSELAYQILGVESLQCFGGAGFLQDYPLEQYTRDTKIDSLYEGTTAMQSIDLFFRRMVKDKLVSFGVLMAEIAGFVDDRTGHATLQYERTALSEALHQVRAMVTTMVGWVEYSRIDPREIYKVGLSARRLLLAVGDLVIGWLLTRQADVSLQSLDRGGACLDVTFYRGKIAAARFFAREVLPGLAADRAVVEQSELGLMDLADEAF